MAEHAPIGYRLVDLPQAIGVAHGVALVLADGTERRISISSRTERGARQQVRRHRLFGALPEIGRDAVLMDEEGVA